MNDTKRFNQLHRWAAKQYQYSEKSELNVIDVTPRPTAFGFKYKMPLWKRVVIVQWGLMITLFGLALCGLSLTIAYVMIKALILSF